ncbi:MAG TPA: 8-amino-7-oxononanoate synthase [Polyangia bacterium]|nr:8-amino-7-oxononanoate synthase [Polyangia bacterium]
MSPSAAFPESLRAELGELARADRLRACPELDGPDRTHVSRAGASLLAFASNDYLGLANHPKVVAAATEASVRNGFGAGAARLVTGDLPPHRDLETALADFLCTPDCLLFSTGYQANIGALTALAGPDDLIASDQANHASLIDGCRLSRATVRVYEHRNATAAHAALQAGQYRRRLLVTESLFSMDGDIAPLASLAAAAAETGAILFVDEAHALGVHGPSGRGACAAAGVTPDVLVGTLGKAFASFGGFVAGPSPLRAFLVNRARTFIFTTAPPPPVAAAAATAVRLAAGPEGDHRRRRLRENRERLITHLRAMGSVTQSETPGAIIPIILGTNDRALACARALLAAGIFVPAIRPPTVPEGTSRLRVTLSAVHTPDEIDALAAALAGALA